MRFFVRFFFVCVVSRHWSTMRAALPTDDATTRAHHAAHSTKRDARCTTMRMRAYDAHDVPRDVRERIENDVALEAWRLAYAREKHLWQTTRERKRDLSAACARLGCEVRETSVLCAHFIDGETFAGVNGDARTRALEKWTAEAVARRVAEMRYIHEYCDEYRDTMEDARARVHEASEAHLRRKYGKKKKYYSKRDAAEAWASACEPTTTMMMTTTSTKAKNIGTPTPMQATTLTVTMTMTMSCMNCFRSTYDHRSRDDARGERQRRRRDKTRPMRQD
jgi:hypothetical protein